MSRMNDTTKLNADRRQGYDLFISHSWSYDDDYERLTERLEDKNNFSFRDFSVPEKDSIDANTNRELRRHLRNKQISPSSVVLILAGMYSSSSYSNWIGREIDIAQDLDKSIVGIEPWGSERTPRDVQKAVDEMVGWNKQTIAKAIRTHAP